jgi:hypothetical protein
MIPGINRLIQNPFEQNVDMLKTYSLANQAAAMRYASLYRNFDINADYVVPNSEEKPYNLTYDKCKKMCYRYLQQDKAKNRDYSENVGVKDFDAIKKMFEQGCEQCKEKYTNFKIPTLDRKDNKLSHTLDNVRSCCKECNARRSDADLDETEKKIPDVVLEIKLKKYAILNNNPFTIEDGRVIKMIRGGITGGQTIVLHRENIVGETRINRWRLRDGVVYCENSDYVMTHGLAWDENSLYPSATSSIRNALIKYTNNRMYMPSRLAYYISCKNDVNVANVHALLTEEQMKKNKEKLMKTINDRDGDKLFIVKLKGGIYDEESINKCINFPPLFRNILVKPTPDVVGEITSKQYKEVNKIHDLEKVKPERKLVPLLSTMNEFVVISTYYLWLVIDDFNFKIDDVEETAVFYRTTCFETWYREMMGKRIEFQKQGNGGGEKYV